MNANLPKSYLAKRYDGPAIDTAAGVMPGTRRAWRNRGLLHTRAGDYSALDALLCAARVALMRHGFSATTDENPLLQYVVDDMVGQLTAGPVSESPRYVVMGPAMDPALPGPMSERMIAGSRGGEGVYSVDGLVLMRGVSSADLGRHFDALAQSDAESAFIIDTSKLLRRVLRKLGE